MPTPKKILIVDDDLDFTKAIENAFKYSDYKIHVANSGLEALREVREFYFDLIMLDLNMPQVDGIHVAKITCEQRPNTKIIVITGFKQQYEVELRAIKIDFIMQKPIGINDLMEKVNMFLGPSPVIPQPKVTSGVPKAKLLFIDHDDTVYTNLFAPYLGSMNIEKKSNYEFVFADDGEKAVTLARLYRPSIALVSTGILSDYPNIHKDIQIAGDVPYDIVVHGKEFYAKSPDELGLDRKKVTAVEGGMFNLDYPKRLEEVVREICYRYGLVER